MLLWLFQTSFAGVQSAIAVPAASHSFASVTEINVLGLGLNPASAAGDTRQISLDVGGVVFALDAYIEGPEQELLIQRYGSLPENWAPIQGAVNVSGISPSPNLAIRIPFKTMGIGWNTFVPYGTGASFDESGPQRYFAIQGHLLFVENALSLAKYWNINDNRLHIGISARHIYGSMENYSAADTGTTIYGITKDDSLILDPIMEGTRYSAGTGQAVSFALGTHWIHPKFSLHASYRSAVPFQFQGTFENKLSTSLTVAIQGKSTLSLTLPQELYLGSTIPFAKHYKIRMDGGFVDWAQFRKFSVLAQDIEITSESPFFQQLLESYQLTTNDLVTADQEITIQSGMNRAYFGRIGLDIDVIKSLQIKTKIGYSTASVPKEYKTFSNGDFPTLQLDFGLRWSPNPNWTFSLSTLLLQRAEIIIEPGMSMYSPYNEPSEGYSGFSGEGRYTMSMKRFGLNSIYQF